MYSNREETNFAEYHYYRLNQIFLSAISLWPFQQSKFTKINNIFHFIIMGSFVVCQLTMFLTFQFTLDLFIMVLSHAIPSILYIVQYHSFYANSNELKRLWYDIRNSWSLLKNERERNIMRQHSTVGEEMTKLVSLSMFASLTLYAFSELLPTILDLVFPLNETRPRELHATTEYFVDRKTYYYPILFHWIFSISFGAYVFVATGTIEMVYFENVCGLFKIASYRIECLFENCTSNNSAQSKGSMAHQNLIPAVDIHRKALKCSEFMINFFSPYFLTLIIIGVASASLNLMKILRSLIKQNMYDLISATLFVGFHFIFMFGGNYYGQKVTDCNNEVFMSAYNVQWYKAPVKIQKLILFIMQSTTTPFIINIGNLILASIEGFTKLLSASLSYFTVMYALL